MKAVKSSTGRTMFSQPNSICSEQCFCCKCRQLHGTEALTEGFPPHQGTDSVREGNTFVSLLQLPRGLRIYLSPAFRVCLKG